MSTSLYPTRTFSTDGLADPERIERWEAHNADALIGLRCEVRRPAWAAKELSVRVGSLTAARVRATAHSIERDSRMIRSRGTDSVAVFFNLAGASAFVRAPARTASVPGQFLVADADRPFRRYFPAGVHELVLTVPRAEFRRCTGLVDVAAPAAAGFSPRENIFAHTLACVLGRLTRDPAAPQRPSAEELTGLLGLALTGRHGAPAAAYFSAAREIVQRSAADPSFCADDIAAPLALSRRQLTRVFAVHGTSVPRYVLGRRLERARELIVEKPALRVSDVARGCGFSSVSYFARAFQEAFGQTPSELRRTSPGR
jgi:AraC-like DNA-binding protein